MTAVTAKVHCVHKRNYPDAEGKINRVGVWFEANYQDLGGTRVNEEWSSEQPPHLELCATLIADIAEGVEVGRGYIVTFEPE